MVGYWFIGLVDWVGCLVGLMTCGLINWLAGGLGGGLARLLGVCLNGGLMKLLLGWIIV